MITAKPELILFHGLNVTGKYVARYSSYSTYGSMGSAQMERVKTHFAEMLVADGAPAKVVCTVLVSANPKGFGTPFRLCGHEIARGEGGSNMARHLASCHPDQLAPEDCLAKGLHPVTRLPIESSDAAPAVPSPPAVSMSKFYAKRRLDEQGHPQGLQSVLTLCGSGAASDKRVVPVTYTLCLIASSFFPGLEPFCLAGYKRWRGARLFAGEVC